MVCTALRGRGQDQTRLKTLNKGPAPQGSAYALMKDSNEGIWTPRLRGSVDWDGVMVLPFEHVDLTQSEIFIDNLLYWLLVEPRRSDNELIGRDTSYLPHL